MKKFLWDFRYLYADGPEGEAAFLEDGKLSVGGDIIEADKVIIATGARPALPSIDGIESVPYLTSTTALELEQLPESLLVIGAGYIGAEIAQVFARAGVKVTIISRRGLLQKQNLKSAKPSLGILKMKASRSFVEFPMTALKNVMALLFSLSNMTARLARFQPKRS